MRRAGGKGAPYKTQHVQRPRGTRLMWLEKQLKRNGGEDETGRWAGSGGKLVLWGGQWGALDRLRAELGQE